MAPIPVYADSPIAAKASGVTPQTASAEQAQGDVKPPQITAAPALPQTTYPQAKPGAVPTLPTATGAPQARAAYIPPTPTQSIQRSNGPPPPQPGAVPRPTKTTHLPPPPPKDGEKYVPAQQTAAVPYPQQMAIPPPTMAYPAQRSGTSSAVGSAATYGGQGAGQDLQHPPGYHQNANASGLDSYQASAMGHNNSDYHQHEAEGDGVWNSAKKWAQATGEKLAAAETEVWKRISKE